MTARSEARVHALLGLCLAFAVGESPRVAHAAAIPAECGSQSQFESELRQRLGPNAALETAHVTLTPDVSGYHLEVEVNGERRELYDPDCHELLRAAVVIVVALLEPTSAAIEAPPTEPVVLLAPPLVPREPRGVRVAVAGGAGVHFGTLPNPALLLDLDAQLAWSRWGVAGGFRYLAPNSEREDPNHGARVSGLGAYVASTFTPWTRAQLRLGVVGYRLAGTGLGSGQRGVDDAWEFGPTLGASFTPFQLAPFWTNVAAEGQLNVLRAHFEIQNYGSGPIFQVPPGRFFCAAASSFRRNRARPGINRNERRHSGSPHPSGAGHAFAAGTGRAHG